MPTLVIRINLLIVSEIKFIKVVNPLMPNSVFCDHLLCQAKQ